MMTTMTRLTTTALALVNGSVEEVREALADYETVRPQLLSEDFEDYQVCAGGHGTGTEVRWTMSLSDRKRRKKRARSTATNAPWDCHVAVEAPEEATLVERDKAADRVTTWTVVAGQEGVSAVRVDASWEGPDGWANMLRRPRQRLAVRAIYEDLLTALHDYFEPDGGETFAARGNDTADTEPDAADGDAPADDQVVETAGPTAGETGGGPTGEAAGHTIGDPATPAGASDGPTPGRSEQPPTEVERPASG